MRFLPLLLLLGCPPADDPANDTGSDTDPTADLDNDGFTADVDCDDSDPERYPGAVERCNGLDDDCDDELARNEADTDGDELPDCWACDDAGFWASTWAVEDASALLVELEGMTDGLATCDYSLARRFMFTQLDNVDGSVEGVYTGVLVPVSGSIPDATVMNTEHTWPRSQGAANPPAECDLHHLYPTDSDANNTRGSLDFGEVVSGVDWSEGGSQRGLDAGGQTVFEPRDSHKGNVARSMFYFATVYGYTLPPSQITLFQQWDEADPVDATERARSLGIAEYQTHANPFVVCPGMAERAY